MTGKYFEENKWWVSPYNFVDEVRTGFELPKKVQIHDATLRDGEQTPGVVFRKDDKIRIAQMLDEVGVDRIEAGMPAVSDEDFEAIKEISKLRLKAKIYTFARAMNADIDKAIDCGAHGVVIEVPIGYPKLKYQFGWTWEDVVKKSFECINYAKKKNLHAVYFPYDTTRARDEDLTNVLTRIMRDSPPDSIGLVDTMGCALPEAIRYMVRKIKTLTGLPVEIHTHNDFGMAVATELAAVTAGAEVVHGCVNGMGERTGNAAIEELMVGLHLLLGFNTSVPDGPDRRTFETGPGPLGGSVCHQQADRRRRELHTGIGNRGRSGHEESPGHVCHGPPALRPGREGRPGKEERQGLHHLHPGEARDQECRRSGGNGDPEGSKSEGHGKTGPVVDR